MKTTIDIPEELIKEAMEVTKAPTKTALIKEALADIIQKNKIKGLKNYKGKLDLRIDLNVVRDRNDDFGR